MRHSLYLALLLLLWLELASSEFLRSLDTSTVPVDVNSSNATALVSAGDSRFWTVKRCPRKDVCFNNPGFLNGFRMYKVSRFRNGYQCKSVCVPTGACLFTACTGNFFFLTLGWKSLKGWDCGTCPVKETDGL